jgi:hypothetical protein
MTLSNHPPPFLEVHNPEPIVSLILHVSPPPSLSDPEEFFYNPSPNVNCGFFAAAGAFFLAHRHQVMTLKCPNLDAFIATSPGAIVCLVSTLPTRVFSPREDSSFLTRRWPVSRLWWTSLPLRMAPLLLLPNCFLTATWSSLWLPPWCLLRSSHPRQIDLLGAWVFQLHLPYIFMGGLLTAQIPTALMWLPLHATHCRILGGMGSAPCLLLSIRSGLPLSNTLAILLIPMGGSSTLRIPLMAGATTILFKHLPATSMGGLCLLIACSPVMGSFIFLPGTSPPMSTGMVCFPLALVSFHMHLHWLP